MRSDHVATASATDRRSQPRSDPQPQTDCRRGAEEGVLAQAVLAGLDEADIQWCLLRGGPDAPAADDDVDILVAAADLSRAVAVIEAYGLIRLHSYGRGTHMFFLGLDPTTHSWVGLDLVTEMAYGRNFEVRTAAAGDCLARRRRWGEVWVLAPDDEFWALLLHCLLDKRSWPDHHLRRLKQLGDVASLDSPLVRAMPTGAACSLLEHARAGTWSALAARRGALLAAWRRAHPVTATSRSTSSAVLRLVERPLQAWGRRGASVALLGPDGSGKSTLAAGIESAFYFPVRRVYMGLWPSDDARRGTMAQVLRILLRPFAVWCRYLASVRHRALGRVVVFDRYVYDALLPPRGALVWLKRPYLQLLSRLCPAPDLVLLLDVPGSVMHLRSGEYDPEHLEAERAQYRRLRRRIPRLEHVDANRPREVVLADALARIWRHYVERAAR
jgi:thymidylate kinase